MDAPKYHPQQRVEVSDGFVPLLAKVVKVEYAETYKKWMYQCWVFEEGVLDWFDEHHMQHPHGMYHDPKYGSTGSDKKRRTS